MTTLRTYYGYIELEGDKVETFHVHQEYRGQGFARKLAELLPRSCWLVPCPIPTLNGPGLDKVSLIRFYASLGFRWNGRDTMRRG